MNKKSHKESFVRAKVELGLIDSKRILKMRIDSIQKLQAYLPRKELKRENFLLPHN